VIALVIVCAAISAAAQSPATRIATTAGTLLGFPFFFHGKQIVVRHPIVTERELTRLDGTAKPVYVFWRERPSRSEGEIRGEFYDLGRLEEGDSRFSAYDFRALVDAVNQGRWPGRDQLFVIVGATMMESPPPSAPSIRSIVLAPEAYEGRGVTVAGRFKGRNLYGDLPESLGKSKWDFVLQSADGAIWVSGLRPRADNLNLDPGARVDTGKWVEVTGTVRRDGSVAWIEGTAIHAADAPAETPIEVNVPVAPKQPPPEVIFSAPVQEDTDIDRAAPVRIQFSRDMAGRSFRSAVRVTYVGPAAPGKPAPPPPEFEMEYDAGTRALTISFPQPLERFQVVKVDLLDGITAVDRQPLAPWSLTFSTGS
jgi:hypothetical protein